MDNLEIKNLEYHKRRADFILKRNPPNMFILLYKTYNDEEPSKEELAEYISEVTRQSSSLDMDEDYPEDYSEEDYEEEDLDF